MFDDSNFMACVRADSAAAEPAQSHSDGVQHELTSVVDDPHGYFRAANVLSHALVLVLRTFDSRSRGRATWGNECRQRKLFAASAGRKTRADVLAADARKVVVSRSGRVCRAAAVGLRTRTYFRGR